MCLLYTWLSNFLDINIIYNINTYNHVSSILGNGKISFILIINTLQAVNMKAVGQQCCAYYRGVSIVSRALPQHSLQRTPERRQYSSCEQDNKIFKCNAQRCTLPSFTQIRSNTFLRQKESLPRLPVPSVAETMEKYIRW